MKISFYGYNTFLIESGNIKRAIDPGALFFYWFRFTTLFPKSEWPGITHIFITHIFITHGDPDHYWHADRVAKASGASVICNKTMLREVNGKTLMLGPRDKGLPLQSNLIMCTRSALMKPLRLTACLLTESKQLTVNLCLKWGRFRKQLNPVPMKELAGGHWF